MDRREMKDDPALLDQMLADMAVADALYKPTNYWQVYEDRLMPTIRTHGIRQFRSAGPMGMQRFGPSSLPTLFLPQPRRLITVILANLLARVWPDQRKLGLRQRMFTDNFHAIQDLLFLWLTDIDSKKELKTIGDSGFGEPTDLFEPTPINLPSLPSPPSARSAHHYTISFLRYFADYLWVRERLPFEQLRIVLELGAGYGGQAEVIKQLYPNLTYIVCDISPQLYVAEQYLKSVFPGAVIGYHQTRQRDSLTIGHDGKIHIIEPFQLEGLELTDGLDLFWNVASFQEMEPATVSNYLALMRGFAPKWMYLEQNPAGKRVAEGPGKPGVLEPVTR